MMNKPRLLDLFSGAGGCAKGYQQAGFYVVGVDIAPQPHYCGEEFYQADALRFPLDGFDVIHASPVCKAYSVLNAQNKEKNPKQIPAIRKRLIDSKKPYVIENVQGAKRALRGNLVLCGTMFGLAVERHRIFESNIFLYPPGPCQHRNGCISVHGNSIWDSSQRGTLRTDGRVRPAIVPFEVGCQAMGIDWMNRDELVQAIPWKYTAWIGARLLDALRSEASA